MKKEYIAPQLTSLKYVFTEEIAVDIGDIYQGASGLLPTP